MAIDLGCHVTISQTIRLIGINAPEIATAAGRAAKAALETWLTTKAPLTIRTTLDRTEKYGRLLGEITREGDVVSLNVWLVNVGAAVPYDGGKR